MAPPGGKSNFNIFGVETAPAEDHSVNKGQARRNQSTVFGGAPEQAAPAPAPAPAATSSASSAPAESASVGNSGPPAVKSNAPPVTAGAKGRPSTKVMAPPGGKTSINLFG